MIIAVAGFGILAIFYMIVVEKTRDIGILKSLGASGRGVMGIFLAYGLSLGLVGSGAGMVGGLLFVRYINPIADGWAGSPASRCSIRKSTTSTRFPRSSSPATIAWIVAGALGIAVLASILPARAPPACIPWRPCAMNDGATPGDAARWPARRRLTAARRGRSGAARGTPHLTPAAAIAADAQLAAVDLHKSYRKGPVEVPVLRGAEPERPPGRVSGDRRAERLGQEHAAAPAGYARRAGPGADPFRGPADRQPLVRPPRRLAQPPVRHDLPVLSPPAGTDDAGKRVGPADDRPRRLGLSAAAARAPGSGRRTAGNGRPGAPAEAPPPRAFRGRNAAGGHRPRPGRPPAAAPGRRAHRQPGPGDRPGNHRNPPRP